MNDYKKQVKSSVDWAEKTASGVLKGIPNLPKGGQKWLAGNIWWIMLAGVILGVIGILGQIKNLIDINNAMNSLGIFGQYISQYTYSGWWMTVMVIGLTLTALVLFIAAKSVQPLKKGKIAGWRTAFLSVVTGFATSIVTAVLTFSVQHIIVTLAVSLLAFLIGAYFLLQIKPAFGGDAKKPAKKTKTAKPAKK